MVKAPFISAMASASAAYWAGVSVRAPPLSDTAMEVSFPAFASASS